MESIKKRYEGDIIKQLNKREPTNHDLAEILKLIVEKMWSEERLAEYIRKVHDKLCAECPRMKNQTLSGDEKAKLSGKVIALIGSLAGAVVMLAGTVAKLAMGGVQ